MDVILAKLFQCLFAQFQNYIVNYDDVGDINDNAGIAFFGCMRIDKRTDDLGVLINFFALCIYFRWNMKSHVRTQKGISKNNLNVSQHSIKCH